MIPLSAGTVFGTFRRRLGSFGRQAILILIARLLQNINGFLLSIAIVRKFGLEAAGSLTVATIATVILSTLCTFGLPYIFAREDTEMRVRNTVGMVAWFAGVAISIPFSLALGLAAGQDLGEVISIFLLSQAGAFFAQTNIANALLVLADRTGLILWAPLGNLIGLVLGYFCSQNLVEFSVILTICRFAGTLAIFLLLPLAKIDLRGFANWVRKGLRFLTADVINLGADQTSVLIASYLLSRAYLGVFGLCRQMLTLAETPGWSRLIACYPKVFADPRGTIPGFTREMIALGLFCGLGTAVLCLPLGRWVYHLPEFSILAPLLLCSVPFRYLVGTFDMSLRAVGAISATNRITFVRCILVIVLYTAGILWGGLHGAIAATVVLAILSAWATRIILYRNLPPPSPMEEKRPHVAGMQVAPAAKAAP